MPKQVTAQDGDTLCGIAMANGFLNCQPLRAEAANAPFADRPLQAGDVVTVPDLTEKKSSAPTTQVFKAVKKNAPPVSIRFVHGSPNLPYLQDATVNVLNISNYVTTQGGSNGRAQFPTAPEFHQEGHADLDTFKVEVVDPAAGASVQVQLEAMRPQYALDPATGALTVTGFAPFIGPDQAARSIAQLDCPQVRSRVAYRSRYLRLVVDEIPGHPNPGDKNALPDQTLLVTDMADGSGTGQPNDNDTLEILDQQVRATYVLQNCPAATPCRVSVQAPIGGGERQRMRVTFHVFRIAVGGANVGNISPQSVRFRTFHWLRRLYAQINLAPILIAPGIEFLDPPPADMLAICDPSGAPADGVSIFGGGSSSLFFRLEPSPDGPANAFPSTPVNVDLGGIAAPRTPRKVGDAVQAAVQALGFSAQVFDVPRTTGVGTPCDVVISHPAGRVAIRGEVNDDTNGAFTQVVARVDPQQLRAERITPEMRRIIYAAPGRDDTIDIYVVGDQVDQSGTSVHRAASITRDTAARTGNFARTPPLVNSVIMSTSPLTGPAMDLSDNECFTVAHELGHVMGDVGHVPRSDPNHDSQLMRAGTDVLNSVTASKRIADAPVLVTIEVPETPGQARLNLTQRIRTNGAPFLQSW